VGSGLVTKLSQPGGNLTGVTNLSSETLRLDWLIEVVAPKVITKIFVPYNPDDKSAAFALTTAQDAAPGLELEIYPREAKNVSEMEQVLADMPEDIDAIYMLPDSIAISAITAFVDTSIERQIPLCVPTTTQVKAGALISYGLDLESASQQAARLAYQIFQGKNAGDLPVEESEFYLAINLDTAAKIDLFISDSIINQADFIYPDPTQ
ncbi:MAG TPA: ABC transporter substrate-binding protein, partial [Anaerolineales bacterium]|nr:ABC transporter substrate-binding protein [Anaerolineales bacterium]